MAIWTTTRSCRCRCSNAVAFAFQRRTTATAVNATFCCASWRVPPWCLPCRASSGAACCAHGRAAGLRARCAWLRRALRVGGRRSEGPAPRSPSAAAVPVFRSPSRAASQWGTGRQRRQQQQPLPAALQRQDHQLRVALRNKCRVNGGPLPPSVGVAPTRAGPRRATARRGGARPSGRLVGRKRAVGCGPLLLLLVGLL